VLPTVSPKSSPIEDLSVEPIISSIPSYRPTDSPTKSLASSDNPTASEESSDIPTQSEERSELLTINEEPTDGTDEPTILTDLSTSFAKEKFAEEEFTPDEHVIVEAEFTSNNDVIFETAEEISPINGARIDDSLPSRMDAETIKQIAMGKKFKETNFNPEATKDKAKKSS